MTALIALIRKDVILFLADRRAMLITLLLPILLGVFFGFVTGGSGEKETSKIEIALITQDTHLISQNVAKGLKAETSLDVKELSLEAAQDLVRKGKLAVAVVIPSGFGDAAGNALFGAEKAPELPIFYDPSQSTVLAMVKGMLTQQVMQSVSAEMFNGKSSMDRIDKSIRELDDKQNKNLADNQPGLREFLGSLKKFQGEIQQESEKEKEKARSGDAASEATGTDKKNKMSMSVPFTTKDQAMVSGDAATAKYNGYAHSFAGMTVQFILFMAIDAGISVLLARKQGLWNRLLAAPVGLNILLIARALSCALIAFVLTMFIFGVAMILFKVKIAGSMLGFLGVALSFSLMTASFGLLIAAFGKTPEAARGISVFATLIMVMLGGAWMPSFLFPQWMQNLTLIVPTRWAVDGFDAMTWRGLGLDAAAPSIAALLAFGALFAGLALWRFRQQQNSI